MSDKSRKITYIDGKFTVYGKEISKLCEKGLMKHVGRREEAKLYASLPIMWCLLTDYNDTLTKDAAEVLVLNRNFNSVG